MFEKIRRLVLPLFLLAFLCSNCFATRSWETERMPYKPVRDGKICWSGVRVYNHGGPEQSVFHVMDLATGKIQTQPMDDWHLIQTDYRFNGTLVVRQTEGTIQVAQWTKAGKWEPFLEFPSDRGVSTIDAQSIVAYNSGFLYYQTKQDGVHDLYRDDLNGNITHYALHSYSKTISPSGNIFGYNDQGALVIEEPSGSLEIVPRDEYVRLCPFLWLNDDQLLVDLKTEESSTIYLAIYDRSTKSVEILKDSSGDLVPYQYGAEGDAGSVLPGSSWIVQIVLCGEGYFNVPALLDLSTGNAYIAAETEHTETFDEYCEQQRPNIACWLVPKQN